GARPSATSSPTTPSRPRGLRTGRPSERDAPVAAPATRRAPPARCGGAHPAPAGGAADIDSIGWSAPSVLPARTVPDSRLTSTDAVLSASQALEFISEAG